MRKLNTGDMFTIASILGEGNILDEIMELYNGEEIKEMSAEKAGIKIVKILLKNINNEEVKESILTLLADVKGVDIESYKKQSMIVTINDLKQLAKENDMKDFLQPVGQSLTNSLT